MMKQVKTTIKPKTFDLHVRMSREQRSELQDIAKARKMNVSEYVLGLILEKKIKGKILIDKNVFELMNHIIQELNGIGRNINQATHALNILKNNLKVPGDEYHQFNEQIQSLLETENKLSYQLEKLIKNGSLVI